MCVCVYIHTHAHTHRDISHAAKSNVCHGHRKKQNEIKSLLYHAFKRFISESRLQNITSFQVKHAHVYTASPRQRKAHCLHSEMTRCEAATSYSTTATVDSLLPYRNLSGLQVNGPYMVKFHHGRKGAQNLTRINIVSTMPFLPLLVCRTTS